MKKTILSSVALVLTILSINAQAIRVKGSDTVLPLSQKAVEAYIKVNPKANIAVTGGGSGVGLTALMEGNTEIAQASRKIKFTEKKKLADKGVNVKEFIIAKDALTVIVNPENKVTNLTREQLEGIFTGTITNWKQVGGADLKIIAYSRESSSGTFAFFKQSVMKNKNYMPGILSMPATGSIVQSVSQTKGAIAYIGLAYLNSSVKSINVSYDAGKTFVQPNIKNSENGTYPIVRPLYYYFDAAKEAQFKGYLDFLKSAAGQKIVSEKGYIISK